MRNPILNLSLVALVSLFTIWGCNSDTPAPKDIIKADTTKTDGAAPDTKQADPVPATASALPEVRYYVLSSA